MIVSQPNRRIKLLRRRMNGIICESCLLTGNRPAAPVDVTVLQLQQGINVSWLPSKHSPVPIEYFLVQYRNMTGRWIPLSGRIDGGQTYYVGAMPSPGLTYQFRVISFGRGLPSNPSVAVTFMRIGKSLPLTSIFFL